MNVGRAGIPVVSVYTSLPGGLGDLDGEVLEFGLRVGETPQHGYKPENWQLAGPSQQDYNPEYWQLAGPSQQDLLWLAVWVVLGMCLCLVRLVKAGKLLTDLKSG